MRLFAALAILPLLTGCVTPLYRLNLVDPQADNFSSALAAEYLDYAEAQKEQGHPLVAQYFAAKGVKALDGEPVEPEMPSDKLSQPVQDQFIAERAALLTVLTSDMKRVAAQKAARAQLLFDCWQHQKNKNAEDPEAPCAEEFDSTMEELETVAESFVYHEKTEQLVSFPSGSAALGSKGTKAVHDIAGRAACLAGYTIELRGNAGSRKSAQTLLTKRLLAIRSALIARQIPPERIRMKSENNSKVVILSNDVVKKSNQVEVTIKSFGQYGGHL